jgi:hypothetical protein
MMAADHNVAAARLLGVNSEWLATGERPAGPVSSGVASNGDTLGDVNAFGPFPKFNRRSHDPAQTINCINGLMAQIPEDVREPAQDMLAKFVKGTATAEQAIALLARLTDAPPSKRAGGG